MHKCFATCSQSETSLGARTVRRESDRKEKQDSRLAPAYFSPEYKYFDQHLQTVKNETTF